MQKVFHVLVVQNGIVVVQNNGKEMFKKVCCTYTFFLLIKSIDFVAVVVAVAVLFFISI